MSRFAAERRVFFIEEPVFDSQEPVLREETCPRTHVCIVTPHLSRDEDSNYTLRRLLTAFAQSKKIRNPIAWFYTPMALEIFPSSISPAVVVYDCMDELSMFRDAPPKLHELETQLLGMADLVFTGGVSLYESKRRFHSNVHAFPSGVDVCHFRPARNLPRNYAEQQTMPEPRLGYAGVIDERLDLSLIDDIASQRPEWQIVMIGPTVKISPASRPIRPNIHWLGMKDYAELPNYFAGWDVGIMPFALNDSTRFISPTKTPEYLSAGLPVVSTAIRDVERPYGEQGLARIAHSSAEFVAHAEDLMRGWNGDPGRQRVDEFLKGISWDSVWDRMNGLIEQHLADPAEISTNQETQVHV